VTPRRIGRPAGSGFSLVECLVALTLLSFSLLALAMLFPMETQLAGVSEVSTTTATLVQREMSQICANIYDTGGSFVDQAGNTVDVSCSGTVGTSCGNPLTASGIIDFTQAPPAGYSAQFSEAGNSQYSVRWNISVTASSGKKIIVAGKAINPIGGLAPVVQFQTLTAP
jgi:prepilin-type N-terminal cleavage/methylation domain-containing protein